MTNKPITHRNSLLFGIISITTLLGACGGPEGSISEQQDNVGTSEQAIWGGTVATSNSNGVIAIYLDNWFKCSGVLVPSKRWAITSQNCLLAAGGVTPNRLWVTNALAPGASKPSPGTLPSGSYSDVSEIRTYSSNVDIAMIKLSGNLTGSTAAGIGYAPSTMIGQTITCEGYSGLPTDGILSYRSFTVTGTATYPSAPTVGELLLKKTSSVNSAMEDYGAPCFATFSTPHGGGGAMYSAIDYTYISPFNDPIDVAVAIGTGTPWNTWIVSTGQIP